MKCALEVYAEIKIREEAEREKKRQRLYEKSLLTYEKLNAKIEKGFYVENGYVDIALHKDPTEGYYSLASFEYVSKGLYWWVYKEDDCIDLTVYRNFLQSLCYKTELIEKREKAYSKTGKSEDYINYLILRVSLNPECIKKIKEKA